jgi:hypothetical protein
MFNQTDCHEFCDQQCNEEDTSGDYSSSWWDYGDYEYEYDYDYNGDIALGTNSLPLGTSKMSQPECLNVDPTTSAVQMCGEVDREHCMCAEPILEAMIGRANADNDGTYIGFEGSLEAKDIAEIEAEILPFVQNCQPHAGCGPNGICIGRECIHRDELTPCTWDGDCPTTYWGGTRCTDLYEMFHGEKETFPSDEPSCILSSNPSKECYCQMYLDDTAHDSPYN